MKIEIVLIPRLLSPRLKDTLCAVIDVLRATTTVITALANGAREVHPCTTVAEARRSANSRADLPFLLGGERNGLRIPGFHLGNSPIEYLDPDTISGKTIYFATTNGTPTLQRAYKSSLRPVYLAALVNLSAASTAIANTAMKNAPEQILLICSGRQGQLTLEDLYCAGLMAQHLQSELSRAGIPVELSDATLSAAEYARPNREKPLAVLTNSEHGRYLSSIGFAADLEFASQMDKYDIVPCYDGSKITVGSE
jgi:2-phosphosulfolactate phosphatase